MNNTPDHSSSTYSGAVAVGSKILMATGTVKNIGELKIGDKVFTFNECTNEFEEATITTICNEGVKKVYNVVGNLWISENYLVQLRGNRTKKFAPYSQLRRRSAHYKLPYIKQILYEVENIHIYNKGYLHGFIDGDGWIKYNGTNSTSIGICQKDSKVLEEVIDLWRQEYGGYKEITIHHKPTPYDYEMAYAMLGNSSSVRKYLEEQDIESKDYYLGYLNGIMISEGWRCYNKADKSTNFAFCQSTLKNTQVCNYIDNYINFLHLENINWVDKKGVKSWRFNKAFRFPLIYGSTKKDSLIEVLEKYYSLNHLVSIEMCKIDTATCKEVECFSMTTTSGTFVVNNVLVHDCANYK